MYSSHDSLKPVNPVDGGATPPPRLLDRLRECIRYKRYSIRTEAIYVYWVWSLVRFHGMRHPREMRSGRNVVSPLDRLGH